MLLRQPAKRALDLALSLLPGYRLLGRVPYPLYRLELFTNALRDQLSSDPVDTEVACYRIDPGRNIASVARKLMRFAPYRKQRILRYFLRSVLICTLAYEHSFDLGIKGQKQEPECASVPLNGNFLELIAHNRLCPTTLGQSHPTTIKAVKIPNPLLLATEQYTRQIEPFLFDNLDAIRMTNSPRLSPQPGRKVYQLKGKSKDLDGVMVFNPQGKPLAFIRLPERCANLTFGRPKNNRLYMTASHSLYALYVEAHGAT